MSAVVVMQAESARQPAEELMRRALISQLNGLPSRITK